MKFTDGIYSAVFRGISDWGMGILIFKKGVITGSDISGSLFDGKYQVNGPIIEFEVTMTVPPGVTLVQGTPPRRTQYTVPFHGSTPIESILKSIPILLDMPIGPVNVIFRLLRPL